MLLIYTKMVHSASDTFRPFAEIQRAQARDTRAGIPTALEQCPSITLKCHKHNGIVEDNVTTHKSPATNSVHPFLGDTPAKLYPRVDRSA